MSVPNIANIQLNGTTTLPELEVTEKATVREEFQVGTNIVLGTATVGTSGQNQGVLNPGAEPVLSVYGNTQINPLDGGPGGNYGGLTAYSLTAQEGTIDDLTVGQLTAGVIVEEANIEDPQVVLGYQAAASGPPYSADTRPLGVNLMYASGDEEHLLVDGFLRSASTAVGTNPGDMYLIRDFDTNGQDPLFISQAQLDVYAADTDNLGALHLNTLTTVTLNSSISNLGTLGSNVSGATTFSILDLDTLSTNTAVINELGADLSAETFDITGTGTLTMGVVETNVLGSVAGPPTTVLLSSGLDANEFSITDVDELTAQTVSADVSVSAPTVITDTLIALAPAVAIGLESTLTGVGAVNINNIQALQSQTLSTTGNATLGSTQPAGQTSLTVTRNSSLLGDLTVAGLTTLADLDVTGDITFVGDVDITGALTASGAIQGLSLTAVGGGLTVQAGGATINGDTGVTGSLNVSVLTQTANFSMSGVLTNDFNAGGFDIHNVGELRATDLIQLVDGANSTNVVGSTITLANGALVTTLNTVDSQFRGTLRVLNTAGTLTTTFNNANSTITGNLLVTGDLTVNGDQIVPNIQVDTLTVTDALNSQGLATFTGTGIAVSGGAGLSVTGNGLVGFGGSGQVSFTTTGGILISTNLTMNDGGISVQTNDQIELQTSNAGGIALVSTAGSVQLSGSTGIVAGSALNMSGFNITNVGNLSGQGGTLVLSGTVTGTGALTMGSITASTGLGTFANGLSVTGGATTLTTGVTVVGTANIQNLSVSGNVTNNMNFNGNNITNVGQLFTSGAGITVNGAVGDIRVTNGALISTILAHQITIASGADVTTLTSAGTSTINGNLVVTGDLTYNGVVDNASINNLTVNTSLVNNGTATFGGAGAMTISTAGGLGISSNIAMTGNYGQTAGIFDVNTTQPIGLQTTSAIEMSSTGATLLSSTGSDVIITANNQLDLVSTGSIRMLSEVNMETNNLMNGGSIRGTFFVPLASGVPGVDHAIFRQGQRLFYEHPALAPPRLDFDPKLQENISDFVILHNGINVSESDVIPAGQGGILVVRAINIQVEVFQQPPGGVNFSFAQSQLGQDRSFTLFVYPGDTITYTVIDPDVGNYTVGLRHFYPSL